MRPSSVGRKKGVLAGSSDGDGSVNPEPFSSTRHRGLVQPWGCRAVSEVKEAFGVHTWTCCIPGAGDSRVREIGGAALSPLHRGPESKQQQGWRGFSPSSESGPECPQGL